MAGRQVTTLAELLQLTSRMALPGPDVCRELVWRPNPDAGLLAEFLQRRCVVVPQNAAAYNTTGCCFSRPTQIRWLGQLAKKYDQNFVLHMDGKYKLHHGEWVLLTLGTHVIRSSGEKYYPHACLSVVMR